MDKLNAWSAIIAAVGPVATAILGLVLKRSDKAKLLRLDRLDEVAGQVAGQVTPNGGSSLRDAVDRIEARLCELAQLAESNRARIETLETPKRRAPKKTV